MKLGKFLLTTSLCATMAVPALAQSRSFSSLDTDGDGQLSRSELEAAFGAATAARMIGNRDSDGDDRLSRDEVRRMSDDESDDEEDDDEEDDD